MIEVWLREIFVLDKVEEKGYWEGASIEFRIQLGGGDFLIIEDESYEQLGTKLDCRFRTNGFEHKMSEGDDQKMTFLGYL